MNLASRFCPKEVAKSHLIGGILMEQIVTPEYLEFRSLMAAIRTETVFLQKMILSEEEEKEETEILGKFDGVIQVQVFSTITNLALYQLRGWRELIDE